MIEREIMIHKTSKIYCCEDISLIENYEKAVNDTSQTYHCHHRKECDEGFTQAKLKEMGLYYSRPANELIFLPPSEHSSLHHKGKPKSEEHRRKIGDKRRGQKHTEETKRKMSENHADYRGEKHPMYGKHLSENTKAKISEKNKGRKLKPFTKEHRERIGKSKIGKFNRRGVSKTVYMYTVDGDYLMKFPSAMEVQRQLGFDNSSVTKCCRKVKNCKTVHGYVFSYESPKTKSTYNIKPLF